MCLVQTLFLMKIVPNKSRRYCFMISMCLLRVRALVEKLCELDSVKAGLGERTEI